MKYGFLFGAGAEVSYGLPSGGKFALDIFRFDTSSSKKAFKDMRDGVDPTTDYASYWLPTGFMEKNISSFGKAIQSTYHDFYALGNGSNWGVYI